MVFDFTPDPGFNFLNAFAGRIGSQIEGDVLNLTPVIGEGAIRRIRFSADFSLLIHHYTLKESLILRRSAAKKTDDKINFLFQINDVSRPEISDLRINPVTPNEYAIRITSTNIASEIVLPANMEIYFTVLNVSREGLKTLLNISKPNVTIETILTGDSGFLFYENMSNEMQMALKALTLIENQIDLARLKTWIKVQQLICLLFERLLERDNIKHRPIQQVDAQSLIQIKNHILFDLSSPPELPKLAALAGMSISKLTDLFRQIFGDSIYNYYQKARMEKAAYLLSFKEHSVAETGYQLGYTNLSHFSRVFEKHFGIKPKRYSSAKNEN